MCISTKTTKIIFTFALQEKQNHNLCPYSPSAPCSLFMVLTGSIYMTYFPAGQHIASRQYVLLFGYT